MAEPSSTDRSKRRTVLRGVVPLFMACWAFAQLVTVQTQGLSSWRGGGFGMYGGFHPVQNDVWITINDDAPKHFTKKSRVEDPVFAIVRPHLTYPREQKLREDLEAYVAREPKQIRVEISGIDFDHGSGVLSRRPVFTVSISGTEEAAKTGTL